MKRKITIHCLIICLFGLFLLSCSDNDTSIETYTVCTEGEIININERVDNLILQINDWPLDIRAYVGSNFPGYYIETISHYSLLNAEYYIVEMNNGGYILFDANKKIRCADGTFNGAPRIDIGVIDTTMNGDTTVIMPDTLISLIETDLCDPDQISFERDILPLMASGCAYSGCHDTQSHEDGIILEDYDGVRDEVNPNNVANSKIIKSFRANVNSDKFMPPLPAISFTDEQVQLVEDWISQGANNTTCNIPCNSLETSWSENIYPLLLNSCIGCHQTANDLGGVNLETYDHILFYVNNGELLGSIKHESGFDAMPEVALKLTDCQIAMIENWIIEGALNN